MDEEEGAASELFDLAVRSLGDSAQGLCRGDAAQGGVSLLTQFDLLPLAEVAAAAG